MDGASPIKRLGIAGAWYFMTKYILILIYCASGLLGVHIFSW